MAGMNFMKEEKSKGKINKSVLATNRTGARSPLGS